MYLQIHKSLLLTALCACSMVACVDDNYDLSDIDTNVKVDVNNLVIPINIDPIELQTVVHLKDDSKIQIVDGQYAVVVNGDFGSDDIVVNPVNITAPNINTISSTIANYNINGVNDNLFIVSEPLLSSYSYQSNNVSSNILSMEHIGTDWTINVKITIDPSASTVKQYELRNLVLQLPKGLEGETNIGTYDTANGLVTIDKATATNNAVTFTMSVSGVNIANSDLQYAYENHKISLSGNVGVQSANVYATELATATAPAYIDINVKPTLSAITVKTFTGNFSYDIDGFNIPQVNLSDLPSVFTQSGTNISIANPQLYLAINNPLSRYNVRAISGFELKPTRNGAVSGLFTPDNGYITVGINSSNGSYDILLSPSIPSTFYTGYTAPDHQLFSSLSNLLSGNGLPTSILVNMVNPRIESTHVTDFVLGNIGAVSGRYTFFAPIQLDGGSIISYSGIENDWSSEDLDGLTITAMTVTADISNDLPVDLSFEVYPLDKNGNHMAASVQGAKVSANSEQTLNIYLEGQISGLDGIEYVAYASAKDNNALAPEQHITVKNVKATITGYYTREL